MKCTCDGIGASPCRQHGYGLLECECGMRFTAPLCPKSFMQIQCPACGQCYSGQEETCGPGCWKKESTDGAVYNVGRWEGRADVVAELRAILDPDDTKHWNKDGVIAAVRRLMRRSTT